MRDAVRDRDAASINEMVLTVVAEMADRMVMLRKPDAQPGSLDDVVELVDWGIRTFTSYVGQFTLLLPWQPQLCDACYSLTGWIDINLTVTPTTVPLLFTLLADPSLAIRLATSAALLKIISKGLKESEDKLQLIKVLSLGQVIDALETKTRAQQLERGLQEDEGEESYREALGKLLNALGLEILKLTAVLVPCIS